jgi:hypothetical protein
MEDTDETEKEKVGGVMAHEHLATRTFTEIDPWGHVVERTVCSCGRRMNGAV